SGRCKTETRLASEPKDIYAEWRGPVGKCVAWRELTCAVTIKNGPNYKDTLAERAAWQIVKIKTQIRGTHNHLSVQLPLLLAIIVEHQEPQCGAQIINSKLKS